MKNWLRRVRGAIGMGLTWAAGWSPIGAVIGLVNSYLGARAELAPSWPSPTRFANAERLEGAVGSPSGWVGPSHRWMR